MILAITFIASALPILADTGGIWIIHENPLPGEGYSEQSTIQMTAEYVDIVLHPEYAQVNAVFEFENTGPACSVGMVFPMDGAIKPICGWEEFRRTFSYSDDYEKNYIDPKDVVTDFQVTADGSAPLEFTLVNLTTDRYNIAIYGYSEWYLSFDTGQKREVVCSYTSDYSEGGGVHTFDDFTYILDTGSSWQGPIGYGKITLQPGQDFTDQWRRSFLFYESPGLPLVQDLGNQMVWEFENLEPVYQEDSDGEDIVREHRSGVFVYLFTVFDLEAINPRLRSDLEDGGGCSGSIFAHFGINFRTEPDSNAPQVVGKETLANGESIAVLERNGDWYYMRTEDGFYGWARWRYVNPKSGEEYKYIDLEFYQGI